MNYSIEQKNNTPFVYIFLIFSILLLQACGQNADIENYPVKVESLLEQNDPQSAIILLKNVLRQNTQDSVARMELGKIYLDIGNLVSSKKELQRAYELAPQNVEVIVNYAEVLYFLSEFKDINQMLAEHESWEDAFKLKAYSILAQIDIYHGYLEQAEEIIVKSKNINEYAPEILFTQAYLKNQKLEFIEADNLLEKLLEVEPLHLQGLLLRGDIALNNQNFSQAVGFFKTANSIYRVDNLTRIRLSQALIANEEFEEAKIVLLNILEKSKDDPYINYLLAVIAFEQKNYAKAAQYAETTLQYSEKHPESLYIAAASYFSTERFEVSYSNIKKFLSLYPTDKQSLKLRAATELKLGLDEDAIVTLSQLQSDTFNPEDSELLVAAGLASLQSGKYSFSKVFLQRAKSLESNDPKVDEGLALISMIKKDVDSALETFSSTLDYTPESQGDHLTLIMSNISSQQTELAIENANKYTDLYPESPHGETLKGLAYLSISDLIKAQNSFRSALFIQVDDPNANQNLAKLLQFEFKDNKEARQLHLNVLEVHSNNLTSLLELFYIDQLKEEKQAISWLNEAIERHPDELYPRYLLAQYYLQNNQPKTTLQIIEQLLPSYPKDQRLLALLGEAFRVTRQYAKAINTFEQLSLISPNDPYPFYKLATIYNSSNQLKLAKNAIDAALTKAPNQTKPMLLKGQLAFATGDFQTAKAMIQKIKETVPENTFVSELEAKIAIATGNPSEAITLLREILEHRETNFVNVQLASSLWQNNQRKEAIDTLTSWLVRFPEDSFTTNALANFYILGEQYKNAINQYQIIVNKSPNNVLVQNNLAWLFLQEKELKQALSHIQKANELSPNNFDILDTYGTILYESGDYQTAKKVLTDALAINPNNMDTEFHLAQSIFKLGELEQAQNILQKLLSNENRDSPFTNKTKAHTLLDEITAQISS